MHHKRIHHIDFVTSYISVIMSSSYYLKIKPLHIAITTDAQYSKADSRRRASVSSSHQIDSRILIPTSSACWCILIRKSSSVVYSHN